MTTLSVREYEGFMKARAAQAAPKKGSKMGLWKDQKPKPYVFVPMASVGTMGEKGKDGQGKPAHVMDVTTRAKFLMNTLDDSWRTGGLGVSYRAYFWGTVFFALTVVSYLYIHVYVAAVFAFLTGYMRSQYLMQHAWTLAWFKGKALIATT
jgi:hypothetical protein